MAAPVLKAQHLGIQFGGLKAVDDFNMEIGESELVGLIGLTALARRQSLTSSPASTNPPRVRSTSAVSR